MDSLSISATVISIVSSCLKTAKVLNDVQKTYHPAPVIITSVISEVSAICLTLSHLQSTLFATPDLSIVLEQKPEMAFILDTSLTGCMLVFSCLDEELQRFTKPAQAGSETSLKDKAKLLWNQDTVEGLLNALHGQKSAINLLLQLLQMDSSSEIKHILKQNRDSIISVAKRSESLRRSYAAVTVPESIYGSEDLRTITSFIDDVETLELEFDFDDLVVNSQSYRRVMASALNKSKSEASNSVESQHSNGKSTLSPSTTPHGSEPIGTELEGLPGIDRENRQDSPLRPSRAEIVGDDVGLHRPDRSKLEVQDKNKSAARSPSPSIRDTSPSRPILPQLRFKAGIHGAIKCWMCKDYILTGDTLVDTNTRQYHSDCFECFCDKEATDEVECPDGIVRLFCKDHFRDHFDSANGVTRVELDLARDSLETRVKDWRGHLISSFGNLILFGNCLINVNPKSDLVYELYLFEYMLLACKPVTPVKHKSMTKSPFQRPNEESQQSTLQLKGRVFLRNVTACHQASHGKETSIFIFFEHNNETQAVFEVKALQGVSAERWVENINFLRQRVITPITKP